jgi:crossover junction endodeoxyribonuclease RuvC
MIIAGLDHSMTSPAICFYDDAKGNFNFNNCEFFFLTQLKKYDVSIKNIIGKYFEYDTDMSRYDMISGFFIEKIIKRSPICVFIEGYSMGSRGKVFNIAENTGIMKYRLWSNNINHENVPPTTIKKFATGKGNADKEKMQLAFMQENDNIDLKFELSMTDKQWNPSSDLIDAYWICKYGYEKLTNTEINDRA